MESTVIHYTYYFRTYIAAIIHMWCIKNSNDLFIQCTMNGVVNINLLIQILQNIVRYNIISPYGISLSRCHENL